jgi:pimeloyl-ACP methyl ester carboxylesterase
MIRETYFDVPGGRLFWRHTEIDPSRPSLLCIHGLGESGLCFVEALREPALSQYNILIPDLLGFGRSLGVRTTDYAFPAQIERLCALLDAIKVQPVYLVGHSMGGDIGTELSRLEPHRVAAFINVEGDLTPHDRFITNLALQAEKEGRFEAWLRDDFRRGKVHQWSVDWPSCVRYAASLEMCQPEAFLESARQIYHLNEALPNGTAGIIGERYRQLNVRRVFCWGTESLSPGSRAWLLAQSGLRHQPFEGAFHWVMLDRREAFYHFAAGFLLG